MAQRFEEVNGGRRVTEEGIGDGETGDWIELAGEGGTVAVFPAAGGTAKAQYTVSRPLKVRNGTARALDWAKGNVTAGAADIINREITAIRLVSISGAATIEVAR